MIFGIKRMQQILINKDMIASFIPQKGVFVFIDNLLVCEKDMAITDFTIKPDNIFCYNNKFSVPGLIENMAQTVAVQAGYYTKKQNNNIAEGYLVAIKDLKIFKLPLAGMQIKTEIRIIREIFSFAIIDAKIFYKKELYAEGELKVFIK